MYVQRADDIPDSSSVWSMFCIVPDGLIKSWRLDIGLSLGPHGLHKYTTNLVKGKICTNVVSKDSASL